MPLVVAAICGMVAGFLRTTAHRQRISAPHIRWAWLLIPTVAATWATNHLSATSLAITTLVLSQTLPLAFAWINRRQPGMWLLGAGLALNLLVIILNDGFMPISLETLLAMGMPPDHWAIGQRLGLSKDFVRSIADTNFWLLSDWLLSPAWYPQKGAFSIGDVCVGAGVFWVLWAAASPNKK
jgi:hypothetical protein